MHQMMLKADREFMLAAVKQNGWALKYASDELKGDREIVLEAVKQKGYALQFASDELKGDREIVLEAVRTSGIEVLNYVTDEETIKYIKDRVTISRLAPVCKAANEAFWENSSMSMEQITKEHVLTFLLHSPPNTKDTIITCTPVQT